MNQQQQLDHIKRVNDGERAGRFLISSDWIDLLKPILDSMIKGLTDIREIDVSKSDASVEVRARQLASTYLVSIEELLRGYIIDAKMSSNFIEKELKSQELYKDIGEEPPLPL